MSVSLAEVARAARARQAPMAAESAGYLVLAVADQVALAAREVRSQAVELNQDGGIRLRAGDPTGEGEAERQVRGLLGELLQAASSVTPALLRVAGKRGPASLGGLIAELEAALIPVNRAAARRALARLSRETARALEQGLLPEPESPPAIAAVPAPAPAPAMQHAVDPEPIEVEVELTPEPLTETRPEPLAARRLSSIPPEPSRTPRIGTLMTPSVRVDPHDIADVTDPMPAMEEIEPSDSLAAPAAEPEAPVELEASVELEVLTELEASAEPPPLAAHDEPAPAPPVRVPRSREPRRSDIGDLLRSFVNADGPSEPELRRELKKIAGLELTPPPTTAEPASGN